MSSMRRYLAALLALVMLLSVFTGALGEEGIAAIEAEAEVLAAEAVDSGRALAKLNAMLEAMK